MPEGELISKPTWWISEDIPSRRLFSFAEIKTSKTREVTTPASLLDIVWWQIALKPPQLKMVLVDNEAEFKFKVTADNYIKQRDLKMTWAHVSNDWKQAGDRIRITWGKLSDDDIAAINGNRKLLSEMLQERYHFSEAKVDEMINDFAEGLITA